MVVYSTRLFKYLNMIHSHLYLCHQWGGEIAQGDSSVGYGAGLVTLVTGTNPATDITFSCAAIPFRAVYNLQHHQRPIPLIPSLYVVGC